MILKVQVKLSILAQFFEEVSSFWGCQFSAKQFLFEGHVFFVALSIQRLSLVPGCLSLSIVARKVCCVLFGFLLHHGLWCVLRILQGREGAFS